MATTGGTSFEMDATGAYGVMGTMDGFQAKVQTPYFIDSVLRLAHTRLADFFDIWLDSLAREAPNDFMHVYEWPQTFGNYKETVGNATSPESRLWVHTFSGRGGQGQASFQFLPSTKPVPVNPILTTPGPGGRRVKSGVHVFHFKAQVMEYGLPVTITPKLAQWLAYVYSGASNQGGGDHAQVPHERHLNKKGGNVMLSQGPVTIPVAGGKHTKRRFTSAFQTFYSTQALVHLKEDILPGIEKDLAKTVRIQMEQNSRTTVRAGQMRNKKIGITAFAAEERQSFASAKAKVTAALRKTEESFITEAARRRRKLYGV